MKLERVFGFSAFLLIPFLGGNHLALLYVTIDRFWIETSFILLMLASIVMAIYKRRWPSSSFGRFLIFFCPFLAAVFFSLFYTWSTFNTLNEINVLIWALAAAFLFFVTSNRDDLLKALVAGAAFSALCAVWQLLVLFPSLLEIYRDGGYAAILKDQHVPFSSFLNQNMLGGYCAAILPLGFYYAFMKREALYVGAVCLITLGLLLSLSRLAVLAGIPSCVVVTALVFRKHGMKGIMRIAVCLGASAAIFLLAIYLPQSTANGGIQGTFKGKIQRASSEASTLNFRTDIWLTGIKAFKESPLLGYGAGSFVYPYQKYYDGKQYTKVAHGTLIKVAVELGILGLLCLFWYCFGMLKSLKNYKEEGNVITGLSALAVFLFGLFDFSFDTAAHVVTFFCLSSVCFLSIPAGIPGWKMKTASIVLVLPILLSFVFTARADSSRRFVEDASMQREGGSTEDMQRSLVEAINVMHWNNEASVKHLNLLTSLYEQEKGLAKKETLERDLIDRIKGMETSRDKDAELFFVLGTAKRVIGSGIESCEYMSRALQYYPSSACYAFSAALCYAAHGRIDRAQTIVQSMEAYYDNYRKWGYPDGVLVHRLKDLRAEIEYVKGDGEQALKLMRQNLESATQGEYVTTDWRARQSLSRPVLVAQLEDRVRLFEVKIAQNRKKTGQNGIH